MIKTILQNAYKLLGNHLEARILLGHATGYSQEYLIGHSEEILLPEIIDIFQKMLQRRIMKEPIAYIIGYKEFYGRNFILDKNVLIPRSDSEILIDAVIVSSLRGVRQRSNPWIAASPISLRNDETYTILELGVGSGCLILTLLLEMQNAKGVGVDISKAALEIAQKNMHQHGLEDRCQFLESDWFKNIDGKYDIIISNPPYISKNDKSKMAEETLLYEPEKALYANNEGYEAYEIIAANLKNFLKPNGDLYIEIGINQENEIEKIFEKQLYKISNKYRDLAGIIRVLKCNRHPRFKPEDDLNQITSNQ